MEVRLDEDQRCKLNIPENVVICILMEITEVEVEVCPAQLQSEEQFEDCRGVVNGEDVEDGEVGPDLRQRLRLVVLPDPLGWLGRTVRFVVSGDGDELTVLLVTVINTVSLVVTPTASHSLQLQGFNEAFPYSIFLDLN